MSEDKAKDILNISGDVNKENLTRAYRIAVKLNHPDVNHGINREKIQEINEAHEILENMLKEPNYKEYVNTLLEKYFDSENISKIIIVNGGTERIDSIHNVIKAIDINKINDDDIIVIHDAVRPFITEKIILDNIECARKYGATVTSVPVNDTILLSTDGNFVDRIPIRKTLFHGQSPDSFNLKTFIELEGKLTDEQKEIITGTSQVCTMNNYPIKMIEGDTINFKITTDADLELAEHIIMKKGES